MKIESIEVRMTKSDTQYGNVSWGCRATLDDGDCVPDVTRKLREFVKQQISVDMITDHDIANARKVVAAPDYATKPEAREDARRILRMIGDYCDDIPF